MVSVIHKMAYGVKHILELDIAGHNLVPYPDDTFIVSYPKSGNTWTRFLIANLLQSEPTFDAPGHGTIGPGRRWPNTKVLPRHAETASYQRSWAL